ncbi:MAG: hypothetical protein ACI3VZ_07495 [Faecousia sp.]
MSDDIKKTGTEQGASTDPIGELLEPLIDQIPQDTYIDIPATETATSEEIVSDANAKLEDSLLKIFKKSEDTRLEQQKPLLIAIIVLVAIQLVAFNVIIWMLVSNILGQKDPQLIMALLEFLKYYIGAVIVELIGLVVLVAQTTFSMHPTKMLEKFIQSRNKGSNK